MHKKLASDLTSIAHSILQMKDKEDVNALKEKALALYEKLAVLAYVEEYVNTTPQAEETKEELLNKIEEAEIRREANLKLAAFEAEELIKTATKEEEIEKTEETLEEKEIEIVDEIIKKEEEVIIEDVVEELIKEEEEVANEEIIATVEEEVVSEMKLVKTLAAEESTEELEETLEIVTEDNALADTQVLEENIEEIEETFIAKEIVEEETKIAITKEEEVVEERSSTNEIEEQPFDELESLLFGSEENTKNDAEYIEELKSQPTLEDELKDTLPVDVMANLFQKAEPKKTVNDHLQNTIQIDLNDRIAFVKHLFDNDQTDFNRVVSQLNTFKTEEEAKKFINRMVKPDYNWSEKEEYEKRFLEIIERKFA